jgi:hypothetical protein
MAPRSACVLSLAAWYPATHHNHLSDVLPWLGTDDVQHVPDVSQAGRLAQWIAKPLI